MSSALLTDRYELTMLDAALAAGSAEAPAVFEVFARSLPPGRRFGVVAGLGRLLEELAAFRFDDDDLAALERDRVVSRQALEWLAAYRFRGELDAYEEGETYFPGSPVCTVSGGFGECLLLETVLLSILNFDSAVASAAARMVLAARGRPLIEMGSRRVHERAAIAAARAAYVAGFAASSNLAAGARYGVPTAGTASHAFVLAFPSEAEAFAAQVACNGVDTTLLVDTFDTPRGIAAAIDAARAAGAPGPGAIRIDSGPLADEARAARRLLDRLGAPATRIVVSSDLDEHALARLADAPVDAYGVGTSVATGSGAPTAGFVYKLVAIGAPGAARLRPVAKRSLDKGSVGGRKRASRVLDASGVARAELVTIVPGDDDHLLAEARRLAGPGASLRPLQRHVVHAGRPVLDGDLESARRRVVASLAELPESARRVDDGEPVIAAAFVEGGGPDPT